MAIIGFIIPVANPLPNIAGHIVSARWAAAVFKTAYRRCCGKAIIKFSAGIIFWAVDIASICRRTIELIAPLVFQPFETRPNILPALVGGGKLSFIVSK